MAPNLPKSALELIYVMISGDELSSSVYLIASLFPLFRHPVIYPTVNLMYIVPRRRPARLYQFQFPSEHQHVDKGVARASLAFWEMA